MEDLVQKLRALGIAVTPQRLAILASLQDRHDHPSAEKIYQEVRRQLPAISFNTVYKTLEVLYLKGLIIKVNPLHEVAHYDARNALACPPGLPALPHHRQPVSAVGGPTGFCLGRAARLPGGTSVHLLLGALSPLSATGIRRVSVAATGQIRSARVGQASKHG